MATITAGFSLKNGLCMRSMILGALNANYLLSPSYTDESFVLNCTVGQRKNETLLFISIQIIVEK